MGRVEEGLQNMYPCFLLNNVCSFHESDNKPNIYFGTGDFSGSNICPLESVIDDLKPDGFHKS